jgi:FkbM family methyltransferase
MDIKFSQRLNYRYFNNKRDGFFIEAGAMGGTSHSVCLWFEQELNWSGINIEPNFSLFRKLIKNRPNSINLNYALSDTIGETSLIVPVRKDTSEMKGHGTISINRGYKFKNTHNYSVKTTTYTNIITTYNIELIDLFVLDVEGHELSVIADFKNCDVLPYVLAVETNKTDKQSISKLLTTVGYKLDWYNEIDSYFVRKI